MQLMDTVEVIMATGFAALGTSIGVFFLATAYTLLVGGC